jgi:molybdenum cofactor sulfurtransferase
MEGFMADMMTNLYGNPHSASQSSQLSTNRIEDTRLKVLQFFKADPEDFDIVFVANATAGIKLVMDAFCSKSGGFVYGYHMEAHTSIVGVREKAVSSRCLDDDDIEGWLSGSWPLVGDPAPTLDVFAYPAQSNLDGRRLPLSWSRRIRDAATSDGSATYTLLDASAFVSTSPLDLSDARSAPDFTVLSFYKIFGFPDLGALIVRKESGSVLRERKYFGGGTVDVVLCGKEQWHAPKSRSFHDSLEDGTLPFHSILALNAAIDSHQKLYGSMERIASHTAYLAHMLFLGLEGLRHANGEPVCVVYSQSRQSEATESLQGPVVTFNLRNSQGAWVSNSEFEKLASVKDFHIRTGGLCNPGGVAKSLKLEAWEMRRNFSAGFRCDAETDIYSGKITGMIRASIGAMNTTSDVDAFISFIREFYVEGIIPCSTTSFEVALERPLDLFVESLTIYPIKSCGGFSIQAGTDWEVRPEGLVWDREWCLVHQGTGQALSQKRYPRMALIRPRVDFEAGVLRVRYHGVRPEWVPEEIRVPLSENPQFYKPVEATRSLPSQVCGDAIIARTYASHEVNDFFSSLLSVPCALARFPAGGSGLSTRHAKAHMQNHQRPMRNTVDDVPLSGDALPSTPDSDSEAPKRPILLSNESPILAINRSSIEALNGEILKTGGKPASSSVFRANMVLASSDLKEQMPYSEDRWTGLRIGQQEFQMLGSCRRCHMVCVDQETAERDKEPFITLAKTRRFESKIFFGSHMCHVPAKGSTRESQFPTIKVGDLVIIRTDRLGSLAQK